MPASRDSSVDFNLHIQTFLLVVCLNANYKMDATILLWSIGELSNPIQDRVEDSSVLKTMFKMRLENMHNCKNIMKIVLNKRNKKDSNEGIMRNSTRKEKLGKKHSMAN